MYSLHSIKTLETRRIKRFPAKTFTNVGMVQWVIKNWVRAPTHHTGNKGLDTRRGFLASLAIHNPCWSRFIAFKRLCIHSFIQSILKPENVDLGGMYAKSLEGNESWPAGVVDCQTGKGPLLVSELLLPVWYVGACTRVLMTRCTIPTIVNLLKETFLFTLYKECALNPLYSIVSPSLHVQWGCTPLLRAVAKGHADIAHFLLASGSVFYERNSVSACVHVYQYRSPIVVVWVNFSMKTCVCVEL